MKFLIQFLIIIAFSFAGELLHFLLPLPIPASIYGIILLFAALELKWIKVKDILTHAGKISAKLAKEKADQEYDKFKERTKNDLSPVEIHFLENFEREQKRLRGGDETS